MTSMSSRRCGRGSTAMSTWVLLLCLWAGFQPLCLFACRYNVRDLGFVDLGDGAYTLFYYVRNETSSEVVSQVTEAARSTLGESNIRLEFVNPDTQPSHPAVKHLEPLSPGPIPTAVLISPDGQALPVPRSRSRANSPARPLPRRSRDLASSPKRQEILRAVSGAFAAVLLIEGGNPAAESPCAGRRRRGR